MRGGGGPALDSSGRPPAPRGGRCLQGPPHPTERWAPGRSWPFSVGRALSGCFLGALQELSFGVQWDRMGATVLSSWSLSAGHSAAPLRSGAGGEGGAAPGPSRHLSAGRPSEVPFTLKGPPVLLQTMLTAISMSAIATNGVVPGKRVSSAVKPSLVGTTAESCASWCTLSFHFDRDLDTSLSPTLASGEADSGPVWTRHCPPGIQPGGGCLSLVSEDRGLHVRRGRAGRRGTPSQQDSARPFWKPCQWLPRLWAHG